MPKPIDGLIDREPPPDVADRLKLFSTLIQDCVDFGTHAFTWCDKGMANSGYHALTMLLIYRHVLESTEGTAVLVRAGCADQCQLTLRSALEALMSLAYMLEADTERRAIAYQVAHIHKRIAAHTKHDPSTVAGHEFLKILAADELCPVDTLRPHNSAAAITNLAKMLARPEYTPVDQEWERMRMKNPKKKALPAWHSLFGGPVSVRQLAERVTMAGVYDTLYSQWSEHIHGGNAMTSITGFDKTIRHLRNPAGCHLSTSLAASFCMHATRQMIKQFAPAHLDDYKAWYLSEIQKRYMAIAENPGQIKVFQE